jgi:hypothetical protein
VITLIRPLLTGKLELELLLKGSGDLLNFFLPFFKQDLQNICSVVAGLGTERHIED